MFKYATINKGLKLWLPLGQTYERHGSDILSGWAFNDGSWVETLVNVNDANSFTTQASGAFRLTKANVLTIGKRYRMSLTGYINTGTDNNFFVYNSAATVKYGTIPMSTTPNTVVFEFTATTDTSIKLVPNSVSTIYTITNMRVYEVQTADLTPNEYNADLYFDDATIYVNGRTGQSNGSMDFDGNSEYLDLGDVLDFGTDDFSIVSWVKPDTANDIGALITKRSGGSNTAGFNLLQAAGSDVLWFFEIDDGAGNEVNTQVITDILDWQFIVVTVDRSGNSVVNVNNGQFTSSIDISSVGNIDNAIPFQIGARNGSDEFDGRIQSVMAWNRIITAEEIDFLYHQFNSKLKI